MLVFAVGFNNCSKCENKDERIFKEKESFEILRIPDLIKITLYNYFKDIVGEIIS